MPRSAWLAVGVVAGAWASASLGIVTAAAGMIAVAAIALLVTPSRWRRHTRPLAVLVLGGTAVLTRIVIGPQAAAPAGIPGGDGPWTAVVESTGAPRDGHQTATVHLLDPSGGAGPRLAATLPVFPEAAPGDLVTFTTAIQPAPASPYGAYLNGSAPSGRCRFGR